MNHQLIGTGTGHPLDGARAFAADEMRQARLARTLRERVMEPLAALRMDAAWMRMHLGDTRAIDSKLVDVLGLVADAVAATHDVSVALRPLALDDLGLAAALEDLLGQFGHGKEVACELQLDEGLALEQPRAIFLYRIVQDWLETVPEDAARLYVGLAADAVDVVLTLETGKPSRGGSQGAHDPRSKFSDALRARVHLLQGSVSGRASPSSEASLIVRVPLHAAAAAN